VCFGCFDSAWFSAIFLCVHIKLCIHISHCIESYAAFMLFWDLPSFAYFSALLAASYLFLFASQPFERPIVLNLVLFIGFT
jgi:hypothetical protein